eukprot:TRINITY_DN5851_c0_g4_i1.p1 TRINITY_DN5851_c0_g4~~TRINITY_DN5851_c0_g4_i1.p1  ORF type:complete len:454 (+),score=34.76 TRINITY_DN5851_c0_g4_i1:389-1750(+)
MRKIIKQKKYQIIFLKNQLKRNQKKKENKQRTLQYAKCADSGTPKKRLIKKITLQLMYIVKKHLDNRHVYLIDKLPQKTSQNESLSIKICRICYQVALAEYQLIEAECRLARIQGIPASVDSVLESQLGPQFGKEKLLDPFLYQWRTMVYLDIISQIPIKFVFCEANYYIQFKIFHYLISFPLEINPKTQRAHMKRSSDIIHKVKESEEIMERTKLIINKLRTFYFFTPTVDLDRFLKNELVEIRITGGPSWENYLAFGTTLLFSECATTDYVKNSFLFCKQVMLFLPESMEQYMKLKITLGLKRNKKKVDTSNINLESYMNYSIYLPPSFYISSDIFPQEWMDIFKSPDKNKPTRPSPICKFSERQDETHLRVSHFKREEETRNKTLNKSKTNYVKQTSILSQSQDDYQIIISPKTSRNDKNLQKSTNKTTINTSLEPSIQGRDTASLIKKI